MSQKYLYLSERSYVSSDQPESDYDVWVVTEPVSKNSITENLDIEEKRTFDDFSDFATTLKNLGLEFDSEALKEYVIDYSTNISFMFGSLSNTTLTTSSNSYGQTAIIE